MMQYHEFKESVKAALVPEKLPLHLQSLWYDAKGDWTKAHEIVQGIEDKDAAWVHAYLHRKEGDMGNADYWYARAGKSRPEERLTTEWETIVKALL